MLQLVLTMAVAASYPKLDALCRAANEGKAPAIEAALAKGKPLPHCPDWPEILLHRVSNRASEQDAAAALKLLIDAGADVNEANAVQQSALSRAGSFSAIKTLLAAGAKCDERIFATQVALRKAAEVKWMLEAGCPLDAQTFVAAGRHRDPEVPKLFLSRGMKIDARDSSGWTVLHVAAAFGSVETAQLLLNAKAEVLAKSTWGGNTPLDLAWNVPMAELLIFRGGRYSDPDDVLARDDAPLFELAMRQKPALPPTAYKAVHSAAGKDDASRLERLLAIGGNPDAKNSESVTPLMVAIKNTAAKTTAALLRVSKALDAQAEDGTTALMLAADADDGELVKKLLELKANPKLKDRMGRTAQARADDARNTSALAAFGAANADASGVEALIWGGGTTVAEGQRWLALWNAEQLAAKKVTLAKGYPQLVKSDDVAGLKPGFFVVLLGTCAGVDARNRLGVLKAVAERVYARPVKVDAIAAACPALLSDVRRRAAFTVTTPGKERLQATELVGASTQWLLVARTATGELLDSTEIDGTAGCEASVSAAGGGVRVVYECKQRESGSCRYAPYTSTVSWALADGKLKSTEKSDERRDPISCWE